MNLPEEAPKLPKFPFIAGDLFLIATAVYIANRSDSPLGTAPLVAITACVIVGAALATIPFLADYARRADAELAERQNQIAALARTTSDSAEQISIVASGLNGISESSKHNLAALEKLPAQLQERIDGVTRQLSAATASAHTSVKEDVARLEAAAEKISRTLAKLETAAKSKADALSANETALAAALARASAQIDAFVTTATTAATRLAELPAPAPAPTPVAPPPTPAPEPAPLAEEPVTPQIAVAPVEPIAPAAPEPEPTTAPEPGPEPEPAPAAVVAPEPVVAAEPETPAFTASDPEPAEVPVAEPEAPKPPRARKPKPVDDGFDLGLTPEAPDAAESSITSDGFTRLIATAYIGIGNKLYIRGEGPGLSWDKGVPLQFVSIGKWRWESADVTATVKAKLYKNDQIECQGLGTLSLEPGRQHEVNAGF